MCNGNENLDWLLDNLLKAVQGSRNALLLSSDGLKKSAVNLSDHEADKLAAMASGLHALGRGVGQAFGIGGEVRQVVVELSTTCLFVTSAGSGAALAVLADPGTDAGLLGYEMTILVKKVQPFLMTPARQPQTLE
ncbi:roadblock/LC7 domain-containing protein [Streptomyces sp. NPDC127084]|uniref:roadblock/LC7 domain-containing protein n=1 Tax=Streptomyces sp. NPDC127084 TaxID=3347133 RepID=UPI003653687C